jgi:DNA helicase-2/ATP-dependent DNA helicase PcrA
VRFILQAEISCVYRAQGRTRKNHNLVFVPSLAAARAIQDRLGRIGNLAADGRPTLGLDARSLLEITLEIDPSAFLIPAHIWTPWFSLLGSKSGFDSVEDCFLDLSPEVFALETGLSADPEMCRRVSGLDRFTLVSSSDAHSPRALGREATRIDIDPSYTALRDALATRRGYHGTIEYYPQEGKYHLDGHRDCGVRLLPAETRALGGRCPRCGNPLTVGVLSRVEDLADRLGGVRPAGGDDFVRLVPIGEVLSEVCGSGAQTRSCQRLTTALRDRVGPDLHVLCDAPIEDLRGVGGDRLAEAVRRVRAGEVTIEPGYDGRFGKVSIFTARG